MRTLAMPLALAASATLILAGCGDSSAAGSATDIDGSASASISASPLPGSPLASQDPTSESPPSETRTAANCPDGRWRLDTNSWTALLKSMTPAGSSVESVDGDVVLNLNADGSYTTVYQDWTIALAVDRGTSVMTRDGTDSGTWEGADGRAVLTSREDTSVREGYVETPDGRFDVPTVDSVPTGVGEEFAYECDGTTLWATTDDGTLSWNSLP